MDQDAHEFHYNPQHAFPDFASHRARRAPANEAALAALRREADIPYGKHPRHRLDLYPAERPGAPIHIFFHGGYWLANSKDGFAFVAAALVRRGFAVVVPNYELCPDSTLDGVVGSAIAAVEWVTRQGGRIGADPNAISLSGHSAGAHLCAAVLAHDWTGIGLSQGFLRGATLISGIYDPAPAIRTTINEDLRLDTATAARHDYERAPVRADAGVHLFAGGREPWRWIDGTFRYAHHLRRSGGDPEVHVLPGYDHFKILDEYMAEDGPVLRAIARYV